MDSSSPNLNGNPQQRRRLTKKPPSHHHQYTRSSGGLDGGIDVESLQSQRSSTSLKRTPSAPPVRSTPSNTSDEPSPRPFAAHQFSSNNPSPIPTQGHFVGSPYHSPAPPALSLPRSDGLFDSNGRPPQEADEFIGAPFDGAAILSQIEQTKSPTHQQPTFRRQNAPPPLVKASTDTPPTMAPMLRHSTSFNAAETAINEKLQPTHAVDAQLLSPKRYSDEGKDTKPGVLRKKSGFSGFVNSLVGSQKKPVISAPENPVHVTHVGYDSTTGQFTVSLPTTLFGPCSVHSDGLVFRLPQLLRRFYFILLFLSFDFRRLTTSACIRDFPRNGNG